MRHQIYTWSCTWTWKITKNLALIILRNILKSQGIPDVLKLTVEQIVLDNTLVYVHDAGEVTVRAERVVLQEALPLAQGEAGFSPSDWSHSHSGQQLVQEPPSEGQSRSGSQRVRERPEPSSGFRCITADTFVSFSISDKLRILSQSAWAQTERLEARSTGLTTSFPLRRVPAREENCCPALRSLRPSLHLSGTWEPSTILPTEATFSAD